MFYIAIGMIALAIAAVIAPLVMNTSVGIDLISKRAETTRRLEVATDAITARIGTPTGLTGSYAPSADTTSGSYSILPASTGVIPTTADGRFIVYCPYAPGLTALGGSPDTHFQLAGASYQSSSQGGYVTASDAPPLTLTSAGIQPLAILIAPIGQNNPRCQDVYLLNRQPTVSGGLVRVVTRARSALQTQMLETRSFEMFASCAGGGDGRSAASPTTLTAAADVFFNQRPRSMVIRLADCTYNATTLSRPGALDGNGRSSRLALVSADNNPGNGSPVLDAGAGQIEMQANLTLNRVAFGSATELLVGSATQLVASDVAFGGLTMASGSRASVNGSSSARSVTVDGDLALDGSFTYSASTPFRVLPAGNVVVSGQANFTGAFPTAPFSTVEIRGRMVLAPAQAGGTLTMTNTVAYAVSVFPGGVLSVMGPAALGAFGAGCCTAIYNVGGKFEVGPGAAVYGSAGSLITSTRGGSLILNGNSVNGVAPRAAYALQSTDLVQMGGTTTLYAGSSGLCQRSYSAATDILPDLAPGNSFAVVPDTPFSDTTPGDPVTALDMHNDNARQTLNARRAQQRSMFSAEWVCAS